MAFAALSAGVLSAGGPSACMRAGFDASVALEEADCDAKLEGVTRYRSQADVLEFCDSKGWVEVPGRGVDALDGGTDGGTNTSADGSTDGSTDGGDEAGAPGPATFAFANLYEQAPGRLVVSEVVAIRGFSGTLTASTSGHPSAEVSVQGGPWTAAAPIRPDETLQARMTSAALPGAASFATIAVGSLRVTWAVTTLPAASRLFVTPRVFNGNLGGIGGAHARCQLEALDLGYAGLWRAALSNDFLGAEEMLRVVYPVVRAGDGVLIEPLDLWSGSLHGPVNAGDRPSRVWTGGVARGEGSCDGWRSTGGDARSGGSTSTVNVWQESWEYCDQRLGLYCLEQPRPLGPILGVLPPSDETVHVLDLGGPGFAPGELALGASRSFGIENAGDEDSEPLGISLSHPESFEILADACSGRILRQGDQCTVTLRGRATVPPTPTWFSGELRVSGNNAPSARLRGIAAPRATRLFVTEGAYIGGELAGLAGADQICRVEAAGLGYEGDWLALLSDENVDARARATIHYPVVRASDAVVIDSANLWDGSVEAARMPWENEDLWTGSRANGARDGTRTCGSWSTTAGDGRIGNSRYQTHEWIDFSLRSCSARVRLHCIEQW